jgi:hypothetical protein
MVGGLGISDLPHAARMSTSINNSLSLAAHSIFSKTLAIAYLYFTNAKAVADDYQLSLFYYLLS